MQHTFQARLSRTCVALAAGFIVSSAFAHTAPLGEEGEIRYNFTANYGIAKRLEAPNAALTDPAINPNNTNANDGNLNFKKGALINNRVSLLGEVDARYTCTQGVDLVKKLDRRYF